MTVAATNTVAAFNVAAGTTLSGLSTGSAFAGRVIVALVLSDNTPGPWTIGGVSATNNIDPTTGYNWIAAVVPTGTTASIVCSGASFVACFGVYSLAGDPGTTATHTFGSNSGTSGSISGDNDSAVIGIVGDDSTAAGTPSWATGLTNDGSAYNDGSNNSFRAGHVDVVSAQTVNFSVSGTSSPDTVINVANFAGSGGGPVDITGTMAATVPVPVTAIVAVETPVWSYIGKTEAAVDASGNYTLSEPSGAQQDDLLVVDIAIRSNVLHTNADWTFPQSDSSGNTTNNTTGSIVSYQTGYCIRGSSAPSYVFAKTGGSRCLGTVRLYRSNRSGTPVFDTSAELAMGAAGTGLTISGGVTTAEADELLVTGVFGARANTVSAMDGVTEVTGNSGATDANAGPVAINTWTERSDRNNGTSPTVALACFDTVKQSAGSTGNLTATESQSARHGMTVMAFKHPALAGAGAVPQVVHHRKMQGMQ